MTETSDVATIELRTQNADFKRIPPLGGGIEGTILTYAFEVFEKDSKVGYGTGHCVLLSNAVAHCFTSLTLTGRGDMVFGGAQGIRIEGDRVSPRPSTVTFLGGTDEFAGFSGAVSLGPVARSQPLEHRLVFHLHRP